jgi:alpha-1,6-mannosyltransferase
VSATSTTPDAADATIKHWDDPLRRTVAAGLAGSALLVLGSLGAGAMPAYDPVKRTPVLAVLRHGAGERVALTLVYIGLAILAMAWLHLGRAVRRRAPGTEETRLMRIAWVWGAPLVLAVPLFSRDLYSYAAQAQITHTGLDPYTHGPAALPGPFLDEISGIWVDTPAPYGPLWLSLGRLVAMVTRDHVVITVLCMRLLAVGGVLLTAHYLPRLAVACGADPRGALWLGLLNPLVLVHLVAGGHNDALMLGLVVAGVTIAIEATDHWSIAGGVALASCAVMVKAPAVLAVAFIASIWARRLGGQAALPRACLRVGAVGLATAGLITLASGLGLGWVRQLNTPGEVVTWLSIPTGLGMLVDVLRGLPNFVTSADPTISLLRVVGQAITVVVVLGLWLRADRLGPARALALSLFAVVMLGPVVEPWYLIWPLTIAAAVRLPHRVWLVAAGASVWLSMMITPQGETLFLETLPTLATALASVAVIYAVLGHERGREPAHPDDRPPPEPLTEPAITEPAVTEPAMTEPAVTEPAITGTPVAASAVQPAGLL